MDPPLNWNCDTGLTSVLIFKLSRSSINEGSENLLELINSPGTDKLFTANDPIFLLDPIAS